MDRSFVLRRNVVAISPLPIVVAVVVDLLDRGRRLRWDVIRKVVGARFDLVLIFLAKAGLTLLVVRKFLGVPGNVSKPCRLIVAECADDVGG
jgi:hypothetical protein